MSRKITLFLMSFFVMTVAAAQDFHYVNYTRVSNVSNVSLLSDHSLKYAVNTFANIYRDNKWSKIAREEAQSKLTILKNNYDAYGSYPDSILNGWHNVVVTDNLNFCRDAKVYVQHNRIREFVIDNCIRLSFTAAGPIKKAKNMVTLQKFNDEQLEVVEVYSCTT